MADKKEFIVRNGLNVETGTLTVNNYVFPSEAGGAGEVLKLDTDGTTLIFGAGGGGDDNATRDAYTGDGTTTDFSLSQDVASINDMFVFVDTVVQYPGTNFGLPSANTIQFTSAPANGSIIQIYTIGQAESFTTVADGTITTSKLAPSIFSRDTYTGDGNTASYDLSRDAISETAPLVFVGGIAQDPDTHYNIDLNQSPNKLIFTENVANGAEVVVIYLAPGSGTLTTVSDGTITEAKLAANSVTTIKIADDAVTGDKIASNTITSDNLGLLTDVVIANTLTIEGTGEPLTIGSSTSTNTWIAISSNTSDQTRIGFNSTLGTVITSGDTKDILFFANNNTDFNSLSKADAALVIENYGSVGIGNTSPAAFYKLSVDGQFRIDSGNIYFGSTNFINKGPANEVGINTTGVTGDFGVGIGYFTTVDSNFGVGIGYDADVIGGTGGVALGYRTNANYLGSVAIGYGAQAANNYNIMLGNNSSTSVSVPSAAANNITGDNQLVTKVWAENNLINALDTPIESQYVANGTANTFTYGGNSANGNPGALFVTVDGIVQDTSVYTADANTITFLANPSSGSVVTIRNFAGSVATQNFEGTLSPTAMGNFWSVVSSSINAVKFNKYFVNTSGGAFSINLPPGPALGDEITFHDLNDTWDTQNLTLDGNGNEIQGANTFICDIEGSTVDIVYTGTQWRVLTT